MDLYELSDQALAKELGLRFKTLRLQKNLTQEKLAEMTTLSLNSIKALEAGNAKLSTIISVLRELKALEQLDNFITPIEISPLQLAKMHGKERQRASGSHGRSDPW